MALKLKEETDVSMIYRRKNSAVRKSISTVSNRLQDAYWEYIKENTTAKQDLEKQITSLQINNYSTIQSYLHEVGLIPFRIFESALELYMRTHEVAYSGSGRDTISRTSKTRTAHYKTKQPSITSGWQTYFANYILNRLDVKINLSGMVGKPVKDYFNVSRNL